MVIFSVGKLVKLVRSNTRSYAVSEIIYDCWLSKREVVGTKVMFKPFRSSFFL
jgi:hypothetical protein